LLCSNACIDSQRFLLPLHGIGVPPPLLQRLHADMDYSLAAFDLHSAFDTIFSKGDKTNAAVAILERASYTLGLETRRRQMPQLRLASVIAQRFILRTHPISNSRISIPTPFYGADSILPLAGERGTQGLQLLEAAKRLYIDVNSDDGLAVIDVMIPHID
jgi:hypothetical protein